MSVSLVIDWPDGSIKTYPFAGQCSAEEAIRPLAASLGMKHVPQFPSWYPIEPAYLGEVVEELRQLLTVVREKYPEWTMFPQSLSRIIDALEQLKQEEGWKASFG